MKKLRIACLLLIGSALFISFNKEKPGVVINEIKVKAPYGTVTIKVPDFSKCIRINITGLGAVKGDKEKKSQAIAAAIDKASGGVVVIPEGEWLTRKIHFKSNVNHLLFIKTNERMGGYVNNIYATNIRSGKIDLGVLGIETDVLY